MCFCGIFKKLFCGSEGSEDIYNTNIPLSDDVRRPSIRVEDEFDAQKPEQNSNTSATNAKSTNLTIERYVAYFLNFLNL